MEYFLYSLRTFQGSSVRGTDTYSCSIAIVAKSLRLSSSRIKFVCKLEHRLVAKESWEKFWIRKEQDKILRVNSSRGIPPSGFLNQYLVSLIAVTFFKNVVDLIFILYNKSFRILLKRDVFSSSLYHIIWNWFSIEYKGKFFALTSYKMLLHNFDILSIICKSWVFFKSFDILLIITQKCNLLEYMCIFYVTSHRSILIVQFSLFFFSFVNKLENHLSM